jgi:hypothetical protein
MLNILAIRGTVCNNIVTKHTANGDVMKQKNLCYITSLFAVRYVTICYISCLIRARAFSLFCLVTPQAYTCELAVGISTVLEITGHFLIESSIFFFKRDHFVRSWPTYYHLLLDTRNKNTFGLGVGITKVFEILGHFLFKGGGGGETGGRDGNTIYGN